MFRYTHISKSGQLMCDVSEYVRRHNVVYQSPARKASDGLPLGNGFMGGMVYHTDRELCMRIGHTDCYDRGENVAAEKRFGAWGLEWEEKTTALSGCGLLKISDGTPAYAWEYLDDYNMTLNLSSAALQLRAQSPFSSMQAKGFGSLTYQCIIWDITMTSEEALKRTVELERYGTRAFFHYYESFTRDTSRRLDCITSGSRNGCIYVSQRLHGCTFTTAARLLSDGESSCIIHNTRSAGFEFSPSTHTSFRLLLTTVVSENDSDTLAEAIRRLNFAAEAGEEVYKEHLRWWKEYWNRSFIHISNEFAENIYYLNLYQFGSAGYGKYPPSVFGSLWTCFGDSRNWGHYYHWNDQMQFWPCDSAHHPELLKPYFNYRRRMLSQAEEDCMRVHGVSGAWYSDIADIDGYQAVEPDTQGNMSCGAMIALQMYRHYKHYPDKDFLLDTAYPVMKACGEMYRNKFVREADGRLHIHNVTAMEGYLYLDDTINDWAMATALFRALCDVAEVAGASAEETASWKDILHHLYTPPTQMIDGKEVFAYGRLPDGSPCTETHYPESGMAASDVGALMCIFPASVYGCYTENEPYHRVLKNTVERTKGRTAKVGWDTLMECQARFGLREELEKTMGQYLEDYVLFPNGLTHFSPGSFQGKFRAQVIPEGTKSTPWGALHEKSAGNRVSYDSSRFLHFYSEPEGCIATSVNESLLQSWEGILRVFSAAGDGLFRLHAEGDFMVTAQKTDGRVRFVAIESLRGGKVTVASPFDGAECIRCEDAEHNYTVQQFPGQRLITFGTEANKTYILFSKKEHIDGSYPTEVPSSENTAPKHFGKKIIGIDRDF